MNFKLVFRLVGMVLLMEAAAMLPAALIALLYREPDLPALLMAAGAAGAAGGLLRWFCRKARRGLQAREGFVLTGFSWLLLSLFGALPFFLSGYIPHLADALFESISGFTTTGASVLTDIEALPHGLLFWRTFTQWIGGMGVLLLFLALLPAQGERSIQLMRAELPGPAPSKLVPKIGATAKILYAIYLAMTVLTILLLRLFGMPLFDSVVHGLGTAGTGGFSIKNASLGAYPSTALQIITAVSMTAFGVNFAFYYALIRRRFAEVRGNAEVWVYLAVIGGATALITLDILPLYGGAGGAGAALRDSFFQVSSLITTTGYATAGYNLWPEFSRAALVCLMMVGACAGSTSGGIKTIRFILLGKTVGREVKRIVHPRSVHVVRVGGRPVEEEILTGTALFFAAYILLLMGGTLLVSLDGKGLVSSLTAVIGCLSNIGPGLDAVGPGGNYASFSLLSKSALSLLMLIGRLEIFPILVLLTPSAWKKS